MRNKLIRKLKADTRKSAIYYQERSARYYELARDLLDAGRPDRAIIWQTVAASCARSAANSLTRLLEDF